MNIKAYTFTLFFLKTASFSRRFFQEQQRVCRFFLGRMYMHTSAQRTAHAGTKNVHGLPALLVALPAKRLPSLHSSKNIKEVALERMDIIKKEEQYSRLLWSSNTTEKPIKQWKRLAHVELWGLQDCTVAGPFHTNTATSVKNKDYTPCAVQVFKTRKAKKRKEQIGALEKRLQCWCLCLRGCTAYSRHEVWLSQPANVQQKSQHSLQ